jgi:hypothetical protein
MTEFDIRYYIFELLKVTYNIILIKGARLLPFEGHNAPGRETIKHYRGPQEKASQTN